MDKILRHHFIFTRKKKLVDAPKKLRFEGIDSAKLNPKGTQVSARVVPNAPPFGILRQLHLDHEGPELEFAADGHKITAFQH